MSKIVGYYINKTGLNKQEAEKQIVIHYCSTNRLHNSIKDDVPSRLHLFGCSISTNRSDSSSFIALTDHRNHVRYQLLIKVPPVRASIMEGYRNSPAQPLLDVSDHDRERPLSYSSDEESSNPATPYKNLSPKITRSDSVKFGKSANGNAGRKNSQPIGNSTPPKPSRRVPSLKLKRMSIERHTDKSDSNMPCLPNCNKNKQGNPSITITIDSDDDSVYSDYLNTDMNYKNDTNKVKYIGDQTSLYGTPKEELLQILRKI
ncbi:HCN2 [Mytilus coruscus]|uniref:HCN2 n=1 Tax=Mytilus coruscus TaxID=42192 RepID=A0A6J8B3T8_MYTCO|nr:HCN2 [Mytilus coruscus]